MNDPNAPFHIAVAENKKQRDEKTRYLICSFQAFSNFKRRYLRKVFFREESAFSLLLRDAFKFAESYEKYKLETDLN